MSFDQAAVLTLIDNVMSHAGRLGIFDSVSTHEPKSAPGVGIHFATWIQSIEPIVASGLSATSGRIELFARLYTLFNQLPPDAIDGDILTACATLLNEYTGDFNFGGTLRMVDLLGAHGAPLGAKAGYVEIDRKIYRTMTIIIPLIFNDMFAQVP